MHVHLSKDLRGKFKAKKRAILVRSGDTVRIMRGPHKGKDAKVIRVNTNRRKVFLEGILVRNARGKESGIPIEPSNLLLVALEPTPERKQEFAEEAFRKKEAPKKEAPKAEAAKKEEPKQEQRPAEHKHEEHKPAEHKAPEHTEHRAPEHRPEPKAQGKTEHAHK
jgi:large subunit ribosomal protein L24